MASTSDQSGDEAKGSVFEFDSLEIDHFRGIAKLVLPLPKRACLAIVGSNNAGKSTVLDALALVLDGPSAHNFSPESDDFFCSRDGPRATSFVVRLKFSAADHHRLPAVRGAVGSPAPVHGALFQGKTDKTGGLSHTCTLMGGDGKVIPLLVSLPMSANDKRDWDGHTFPTPRRYARWQDISGERPEVWLLRPNNLHPSLFTWKTGPLQRLSKLLVKRFIDEAWEFEHAGKPYPMPETIRKAHAFFAAAVSEFPFWKEDLKPRLEATLSQYVGRQAAMHLRPDISTLEEWLTSQLMLAFASDTGGYITPLERMGSGWQSLVRIACLEVLSQYPEEMSRSRVALLFEEPESYLHPHLSRKLRSVLDRLAEIGWLVVVTTHSPDFISFSGNQTISRMSREGDRVQVSSLDVSAIDSATKFQERLDERGGHELLFAQRIVLCEGQDDVFALRSYLLKRANLDLDGMSVSIIRAGDVGQLPAYAAMAGRLGIPWIAVSDEDLDADGTIKNRTAEARKRLSAAKSPRDDQAVWKGNLEKCLGKAQGKAEPEWQRDNIEPLTNDELKASFPEFVATAEKVMSWVSDNVPF